MASRLLLPLSLAGALLLSACASEQDVGDEFDERDAEKLALGEQIYVQHCAACHGEQLEGEPDWRRRGADGRLPAPPHDDSGHTWHHPDEELFLVTRDGMVPPLAPEGYESNMPAFGDVLSDEEIRAVIVYIKSHWSDEIRQSRRRMLDR